LVVRTPQTSSAEFAVVPAMTYYLIFQESTLRLIPVRPEQEEAFCRLYAQRVLASGERPLAEYRNIPNC
jgi:hypothetical protein